MNTTKEYEPDRCPGCGRSFECGLRAGREPCWCAALPPVEVLPTGGAVGCFCPDCLARRVAEAAGSGAG